MNIMGDDLTLYLQICLIGFFGAFVATGLMRVAGLGDAPDARSAHRSLIPTGGGVGMIVGLGLALCALSYAAVDLEFTPGFVPFLALIFAVGLLGICDDYLTLSAKLKFGILGLICVMAVWTIGPLETFPGLSGPIAIPSWIGFGGAVLWLFVVMNAVNFMDGANGMIGISLSLANIGLCVIGLWLDIPSVACLSGLMAAVTLGFLPYNLRNRAKIFCGDVGALMLGFTFAGTILFLLRETPGHTYHLIGPILILPLLADVLLTMLARALRHENLLQPHNTHLYQRLIRHKQNMGQSGAHLKVSWVYGGLTALMVLIVWVGIKAGWAESPLLFIGLTGGFIGLYRVVSQRLYRIEREKSEAS